jgi:hypothetical protein
MNSFLADLQQTLGPVWPVLVFILILVAGYIVAKIIEGFVRAGLRKTGLDDRLADHMKYDRKTASTEKIGGKIVFWVIMVIVFIAAFEVVNMGAVSGSLGVFVERILGFLPNLIGAALLAFVAVVVATVMRFLTKKALEASGIDKRLRKAGGSETEDAAAAPEPEAGGDPHDAPATGTPSVSASLSEAVFYFILLLFLPAILEALQLHGILVPVQGLVSEILAFLPNLLLAAVVLLGGWFAARVVRKIVTNLLSAAGADQLGERVGMTRAAGRMRLSDLIGLVVYILILVPVIVAALNALQVQAVTEPASATLAEFLLVIPRIFAAVLILVIAYVVGRLLASLLTSVLTGVGFNHIFQRLGFSPARPAEEAAAEAGTGSMSLETRSPSGIVGIIVLVALMLFAAAEAANALRMVSLAQLISDFTVLSGRILLGLLIFGVGLYLANLAYDAVKHSDTAQATVLALAARVSILVLAAAMGLRQMGLADSIINLAFGITLGAIAVAAALAFGLGGRKVAREQLERLVGRAGGKSADAPSAPKADPS